MGKNIDSKGVKENLGVNFNKPLNYYSLSKEDLENCNKIKFTVVPTLHDLNIRISREIADHIKTKNKKGEKSYFIFPVGPLDYSYLADICNRENIDLKNLEIFMMDEYVGEDGNIILQNHPLSFFSFMKKSFVDNLDVNLGFDINKINFPNPKNPEDITMKVELIGGVDICYGGLGITGHLAFNDPPESGIEMNLEGMKNTKARILTISRESITQMAIGGTNGNLAIIPTTAVSLGMYELLMSKKIHLTFMRSWHSGVLRRALFGPISVQCPGSLVQEHPNFEITLTEISAQPPFINVTQATSQEK